jgi:hypothetical protein
MAAPIEHLDVPQAQVESDMQTLIARQKAAASGDRLRWLIAHPQPADEGTRAEYRHLLYDADPDSTTPAFVSLTKGRRGGTK